MTKQPFRELAAAQAGLRRALESCSFADDGEMLRGPVPWTTPAGEKVTATVDIKLTEQYPFAPPKVSLVSAGTLLEVTFHRDPDGGMCLWDTTEPVNDAPWTHPASLIEGVAGWLRQTAAGWPNDEECDLERYMNGPRDGRLVLYDDVGLHGLHGCLRTEADPVRNTITVLAKSCNVPSPPRGKKGLHRTGRHLAWLADVGLVNRPITCWEDVQLALGDDAVTVRRLVAQGSLDLLLVRYRRGSRSGMLALAAGRHDGRPIIRACEAADTSEASRRLRSGVTAAEFVDRTVAILGCGAVGAHLADQMFRDGVRHLTLIDPQTLRPGNVVRHLAGDAFVGLPKVEATKSLLQATGLGVNWVQTCVTSVTTPTTAITMLQTHDVVVDATADERATALLRWAAEQTGRPVVSVGVQRQGGIVRVDRFPLRGVEEHLPEVPPRHDLPGPVRERGCGDAVSLTPPSAVVAAAELAGEIAIDELTSNCRLPPSMLRVLRLQPDAPYDRIVTLATDPGARA